jgi:hypothetical protein
VSLENLPEDHRARGPELFLDTSIAVSKHKGPLFTGRIDYVFSLFRWRATSSYAKTEYGNVVLAQAEYVLRKLKETRSLRKTCDWIANVLPGFHDQKRIWTLNLLSKIHGMSDEERTERAILALTRLLKLGVRYLEIISDKPIENGTDCYWAKVGVQQKADGALFWQKPRCTISNPRCRIHKFFEENRELFLEIKAQIDALPEAERSDQLRGFSDVIEKAKADPSVLLDYKSGCCRLADALIAVDSRNYGSMFSMNAAESVLLTKALNQDFYFLPPNPSEGSGVKIQPAR